jgi:curli biogenesis system outer membrane secretion channel CsgG
MLTTTLVKSGKYIVFERKDIQKILNEQKLGQSGLVNPRSAAQVGKLLGVKLAIMGVITEFSHSTEKTGGKIKWLDVGVSTQKATVAIEVRFVNTTTGEIIAAENVRRVKSKSGLKLSAPEFGIKDRDGFDNSLIGKATREAVDSIVSMIENQMQQLPWQGKIIKVSGNTVYIKPGSDAGVKIGDTFAIYTRGEELIDPDTGISLGSEEEQVGSIQIKSIVANGKAAKGIIVNGSDFKIGNIVRIE